MHYIYKNKQIVLMPTCENLHNKKPIVSRINMIRNNLVGSQIHIRSMPRHGWHILTHRKMNSNVNIEQ